MHEHIVVVVTRSTQEAARWGVRGAVANPTDTKPLNRPKSRMCTLVFECVACVCRLNGFVVYV